MLLPIWTTTFQPGRQPAGRDGLRPWCLSDMAEIALPPCTPGAHHITFLQYLAYTPFNHRKDGCGKRCGELPHL